MNEDLDVYGITSKNIFQLDERTFHVHQWEWSYSQSHAFQRRCLKRIEENPRERWLITCSHPRVLTHGRGLQKPKKGESFDLKDFDPSQHTTLPYPLFQIERGGGLTFHHPGQFIFYPIVKLNPRALSLSKMIDDIFEVSSVILGQWGISNLSHHEKLLGLWWKNRKMASMGIAIEKLTTFHGMALNMFHDDEMQSLLKSLNPCGISSDTYIAVDEILPLGRLSLDEFKDEFIKRIIDVWK